MQFSLCLMKCLQKARYRQMSWLIMVRCGFGSLKSDDHVPKVKIDRINPLQKLTVVNKEYFCDKRKEGMFQCFAQNMAWFAANPQKYHKECMQ